MWLSEQAARTARQPQAADVGRVTIAGSAPSVVTDAEVRDLAVFSPGGYRWRPSAGARVLVLKAGAQEVVAGTEQAGDLLPGQIVISTGAASISLLPNGVISMTGNVLVNGQAIGGGAL